MKRRFSLSKGWLLEIALLLAALTLAACGGRESPPQPALNADRPQPPAPYAGKSNPLASQARTIEAGKQTFRVYCASCHGETGMGDGPASGSLNPKPQPIAQTESQLSDDYLYWRIAEGGLMEPFMSAMPAWKSALSEEQIWQVVIYLRSLD